MQEGDAVARNLITDIPGVRVGHADDAKLGSGSTVVVFDKAVVASVDVRGGGPGTRETALLDPAQTIEGIDAIVLSGGSAFGLDAASGVQAYMREQGRGFRIRDAVVPIIPGAIMFDLLNGGDKNWGRYPPYRELAYQAAAGAGVEFALGSAGAGLGATTATLKGGVGSASAQTRGGITVGALVVVNAVGTVVVGDGPHFWAAPFEQNGEFGGRGLPARFTDSDLAIRAKGGPQNSGPNQNTTIAVIATDAALTKAQCNRLAVMAHDGYARAIYPVHTPLDGDVIFSAATGTIPLPDPYYGLAELGMVAGNVMARAIARGIYEATALPFPGALPSWKDRHG
jgi:L-aminopeptidase/D-esterase-like protein